MPPIACARRLLRARRERPRRRAGEERDELAAVGHSITSVARSRIEAKVTFSLERRTTMVIKLSSSSTDALLVAEHSNVPIHLQAGDPLDIAGVVARRDYTFLLVDWGICRPLINNLLTGLLFLFQTAVNADGVVWAKDRAHSFLTRLAALSNVYGRHTPGLRASIGGLLLRLCLGSLLLRLCLDGRRIELLVALNVGRQIGRPRLPVSNRSLQARVGILQRRGGVLAYGYASSRQEGPAGGRIRRIREFKPGDGRLINFPGRFESPFSLERDQSASGTGS